MSFAKVEEERLARDIEAIASFNEADPKVGYSRPTFSPSWRRARDYVIAEAEAAGCASWVDAAGNVHARPSALEEERRAWLCGSHIDSVPTGGKFDGVVGVVVALEVLRAAPEAPVELIVFAEEEGTTFGLGMVGSRAWAGTLSSERLGGLRNAQGMDYLSAGAAHGVAPERLTAERLEPERYLGLIEAHVEQGPGMWKAGLPLSVVTAIAGRRQYACSLAGEANHAGATAMRDRRDALAGAAQAIGALEAWARGAEAERGSAVLTVGRLDLEPNAINVIPGRASFSIDLRARSGGIPRAGRRPGAADRRRGRCCARSRMRTRLHRGAARRTARSGPLLAIARRRSPAGHRRAAKQSAAPCTTPPSSPGTYPRRCSS